MKMSPFSDSLDGKGRNPGGDSKIRSIAAILLMAWASALRAAEPVKLSVVAGTPSADHVPVTVTLLDASNHPVPTAKPLVISVSARDHTGKTTTTNVIVNPGSSSGSAALTIADPGLAEISATHRELLESGTFVNVKPKLFYERVGAVVKTPTTIASEKVTPPQPTVASAVPPPTMQPHIPPSAIESHPVTPHHLPPSALGSHVAASGHLVAAAPPSPPPPPPEPSPVTPAPAPTAPPPPPTIAVRYAPHRTLLADGKDLATIMGFAVDDRPPDAPPIKIRVTPTDGTLTPIELVIPQGADRGQATLVSDHVGSVDVGFLRGNYTLDLDGKDKLTIPFGPPIHQLQPLAPPSVSLVDTADLVVELRDERGTPVAADAPRHVVAALIGGSAALAPPEQDIAAGQSSTRLTITPTGIRPILLTISSVGLPDAPVTINVGWPILLLTLTLVGGLAGGWVAAKEGHLALGTRILVGVITGFALYWGTLYVGLGKLPRTAVLNPLTALAVAAIGGYAGTAVLNALLKNFDLGSGKPA
jgi:hypothetical protein